MNANSTVGVVVESGGEQVVAHVGLHAVGSLADRLGLASKQRPRLRNLLDELVLEGVLTSLPGQRYRAAQKRGLGSWEFFDQLLTRAHVVGTPGAGFGPSGEGFLRLSAFNSRQNVEEAIARIRRAFAA